MKDYRTWWRKGADIASVLYTGRGGIFFRLDISEQGVVVGDEYDCVKEQFWAISQGLV